MSLKLKQKRVNKYLNWKQNKNFWNKVDIKGPDDCWEWIASLNGPNGYGQFKLNGRMAKAHRVAFINTGKMKNKNNWVLHKCDNPKCCNPNHLFEGTQQDNMLDMYAKSRGKGLGIGKLNSEAVKVIKWMLKYKPYYGLALKLSFLYKVNHRTISAIKFEKSWQHIKV